MSEIIVQPNETIEKSISYLELENRLAFDGSTEFTTSVDDKILFIKIILVNIRGEKAEYEQAVYIISKTIKEA